MARCPQQSGISVDQHGRRLPLVGAALHIHFTASAASFRTGGGCCGDSRIHRIVEFAGTEVESGARHARIMEPLTSRAGSAMNARVAGVEYLAQFVIPTGDGLKSRCGDAPMDAVDKSQLSSARPVDYTPLYRALPYRPSHVVERDRGMRSNHSKSQVGSSKTTSYSMSA